MALPVTVSVSLILPVSKASATSSMVISFVTDAGERLSWAFFSKSTAPVSALTSTALGASTVFSSTAAKQGAGVLLSMLLGFGFVVAVGALYFFLLAELMPTTAFLGLILALMAILYALTARWLMTRGVKRFETLR